MAWLASVQHPVQHTGMQMAVARRILELRLAKAHHVDARVRDGHLASVLHRIMHSTSSTLEQSSDRDFVTSSGRQAAFRPLAEGSDSAMICCADQDGKIECEHWENEMSNSVCSHSLDHVGDSASRSSGIPLEVSD
ncbi:uncharacterized protein N7515_006924 [Penicillium bovifimosum]|uniref:Uncharacterized protein n=1 Tax=Penicillium bovifimosum TaxID=126998 RepID=A0A9W9GVL6_9EURO|nr:uncharacterized protein N7515_006924 [Penicillium bovifimosum]KAJ5130885.1 hypothetical protein N7515_006924 [Penicillium bovifimosum]